MGPELAAVATLWGLAVEYGPWFVVLLLVAWYQWRLDNNKIYLGREYTALFDKAAKRETDLVSEVQFWKDRYLNESALSHTAVGALTTPRGQR